MNSSYILFAPAGKWQLLALLEAKKLGYKIISVDGNKNAEGFNHSDISIVSNLNNYDQIFGEIQHLNILTAISFCSDIGINLCTYIREKLNIEGYSSQVAKNLTNKSLQRNLWKKEKVGTQINFQVFNNPISALNYIKSRRSRNIIKPVDSSGSRGVFIVTFSDDYLLEKVKTSFQFSNSNTVIVEDYIHGEEYTIEFFNNNNTSHLLAITKKKKLESTNGTVAYELFTPDLDLDFINEIKLLASNSSKALKYNSGVAHLEIIIDSKNRVYLIELAGRGGGFGLNNFMIPKVTGINITKLTVLNALNEHIKIENISQKKAILRFIPTKKGVIKKIEISENISQNENIFIRFFYNEGDELHEPKSDGDRLCLILVTADNLKSAQNILSVALDNINIIYS